MKGKERNLRRCLKNTVGLEWCESRFVCRCRGSKEERYSVRVIRVVFTWWESWRCIQARLQAHGLPSVL